MVRTKYVIARLSILSLWLLSTSTELARAVRRPVRSVAQCDRHSAVVPAFTDDKSCRLHCEATYMSSQSRNLRAINKRMLQASIRHTAGGEPVGERVHFTGAHRSEQPEELECCCAFEAPWPQFVRREAIGRERDLAPRNEMIVELARGVCLPIVVSVGLSKRTRDSYDTLCRYLSHQHSPVLTVLELMQYAEAAAYLNFMQPKHPAIMLVLREKRVKRIQKPELQELRRALHEHLLDDTFNRRLTELPGYKLALGRLNKLTSAKREMPNALKVDIIHRAFEELAISQVLVDVAAVAYRLRELNFKEFRLPAHLLAGDYDKYDTNLASYFTIRHPHDLDCRALAQTRHKISIYLSTLRPLLDSFREKGLYDHMSQKYQPLIDVLGTDQIYKNLLLVNCNGKRE